MRRALPTALTVLIGTSLLLAQDLPSKKEVSEWVQASLPATILRTPDTPPYHISAKFHYEFDAKSSDGTLEYRWGSPSESRLDFHLGSLSEIDVEKGNHRYVLRNTPTITLALWDLKQLLNSPVSSPQKSKPVTVHFDHANGDLEVCLQSQLKPGSINTCLNASTRRLTSQEVTVSTYDLRRHAGSFMDLGTKRLPARLFQQIKSEKIDVTVDKFESLSAEDRSAIAPLRGAEVTDWCANPEKRWEGSNRPERLVMMLLAGPGAPTDGFIAFSLLIGPAGRPKQVTSLNPGSAAYDQETIRLLRASGLFAEHDCAGHPIEYETVFEFFPQPPVIR